jgi:predicted dehydrogenase
MDKLRIGLIGCGGIARRRHAPALAAIRDIEVAAICDVDPVCTSAVADQFKIAQVFGDYRDMLEHGEIDAVDICTPNFLHATPAIEAMQAGKHVLVEKPIGRNAEEAQAIIDASRKTGKKLMVGQCLRFCSDAIALKRFVDAGKMGDMYYGRVRAIRRRGIPTHGNFIDKDRQGGGPLIDIGVHWLDYALWLMGHPKPVSVSGAAYTKFGNRSDVYSPFGRWDHEKFTVEDFASGLVRFENGATLTIEASFAANIEKDAMDLAIMGTEGGLQANPARMFREEDGNMYDLTPVSLPEVNMYQGELQAFVDCIKNDTTPPVTGEQALMVMKILDGIYESSNRGAEVRLD